MIKELHEYLILIILLVIILITVYISEFIFNFTDKIDSIIMPFYLIEIIL